MIHMIDVAMKYLSDGNCSERELRLKLEKQFVDLPEVDKCIDSAMTRLRELHLLSDVRFADTLAGRYAHKGDRFITQVLRQKGMADTLIAATLAAHGDEHIRALEASRKKRRSLRGEGREKGKTRLARFLSGRGFSYETIDTVLRQLDEEGFFVSLDESIGAGLA